MVTLDENLGETSVGETSAEKSFSRESSSSGSRSGSCGLRLLSYKPKKSTTGKAVAAKGSICTNKGDRTLSSLYLSRMSNKN
jgi:hypothetical protein